MFNLDEIVWLPHYTAPGTTIYRHALSSRPLILSYEDGYYYIYSQSIDLDGVLFVRKEEKEETEKYISIISDFYLNELKPLPLDEIESTENYFLLNANVGMGEPLTMDETDCINTV